MKPYPFTEAQLAWLHDLETTTEPQTIGALHRVVADGLHCIGFCCLGRGAVTLGARPAPWAEDNNLIAFHGSSARLMPFRDLHLRGSSGELLSIVGGSLDDDLPFAGEWSTLAELNDDASWTFPEIAAYIRKFPWNVFTDPAAEHAHDCPHVDLHAVQSCSCDFYKRDFGNEN